MVIEEGMKEDMSLWRLACMVGVWVGGAGGLGWVTEEGGGERGGDLSSSSSSSSSSPSSSIPKPLAEDSSESMYARGNKHW